MISSDFPHQAWPQIVILVRELSLEEVRISQSQIAAQCGPGFLIVSSLFAPGYLHPPTRLLICEVQSPSKIKISLGVSS